MTPVDWNKWRGNTMTFLAPLGVIYFGFFIANLTDGFQLVDFVPDQITIGAMMLYLGNVALDFFRKYVPAHK